MALSDLLPPAFKSGPSPEQAAQLALSPASVERRRRVAEAMMKQGMDYSPIQSPWQGVARVTNAIMGGLDERKADDIERAGLASQRDADASMYGGLTGSAGVPITGAAPTGGVTGAGPAITGPQSATDASPAKGPVDIARADQAIKNIESSGGNYAAVGPVTTYKDGRQDRPYGAHQVMGANIPVWTKQYYGQELTPAQYLQSPEAQQAVFAGEFSRLASKYGPEGAAQAWLGGEGSVGKTGRRDVLGTSVGDYGQRFAKYYGDPQTTGAVPAPVQVASADPNFAPQVPGAGITDAPVAVNPPPVGASGPLSPAAAAPLNPGAITDAPLPPGVLPPAGGAPMTPNGLPSATNLGLRNQGIDPNQFMPQGGAPTQTGSIPLPPVDPRAVPQAPVAAPAAPPTPRAAVLAALQGSPDLKDSQVQMMIARGINPANPQAPVSPARQSILAALSGAAPAPPQATQSPAAAQVTGALAAPATVPASSPQQPPPYPGQPAPVADAGGNPAQLAAAIKTMSNPWAPEGSRAVAKTIIDRELQSRDPLRQLQVEKLRLELGGGTADEKRARQLAIQKAEKELATPPEEWAMSDGVMYNKRTGEQKTDHAGMFMGKSVDAQALNYLVQNGQLSKEDAANIAAGKPITGPNGEMLFLTPKGIMSQKPGQPEQPLAISPPAVTPQGAPASPPAASPIAAPVPQSNPGIIPITAPKPVKASEAELNAQTYADRMKQSGAILDDLGMKGTGVQDQIASQVPLVGNSLVSEDFQKADQAKRDFINAQLRRESGAAISAGEFESANKQYFPQRGDTADVIAQKAINRKTVIDGMIRSGGPTYKPEAAAPPPAAPPPEAAPAQPAQPPMEGARRAPNGKWYVKNPAYGTDPTAPQWFEVQH